MKIKILDTPRKIKTNIKVESFQDNDDDFKAEEFLIENEKNEKIRIFSDPLLVLSKAIDVPSID